MELKDWIKKHEEDINNPKNTILYFIRYLLPELSSTNDKARFVFLWCIKKNHQINVNTQTSGWLFYIGNTYFYEIFTADAAKDSPQLAAKDVGNILFKGSYKKELSKIFYMIK